MKEHWIQLPISVRTKPIPFRDSNGMKRKKKWKQKWNEEKCDLLCRGFFWSWHWVTDWRFLPSGLALYILTQNLPSLRATCLGFHIILKDISQSWFSAKGKASGIFSNLRRIYVITTRCSHLDPTFIKEKHEENSVYNWSTVTSCFQRFYPLFFNNFTHLMWNSLSYIW